MTEARCTYCNAMLEGRTNVYRRVTGWERRGTGETRRGGSDIVLREHVEEFACVPCISLLKSRVHPGQEALL